MKRQLPKITEPDAGEVHYGADNLSGNVTLCGLTDFLGGQQGTDTDDPVTCGLCKHIVDYIHSYAKPKDL